MSKKKIGSQNIIEFLFHFLTLNLWC